jgi:hypothetical protein
MRRRHSQIRPLGHGMIVVQIPWGASPTLLLGTADALVIGNVRRAQCFLLRVCKFFFY